jgi:hypothetical protein
MMRADEIKILGNPKTKVILNALIKNTGVLYFPQHY